MKLAPSMLACDFSRFAEAVALVQRSGADMVHLDIMDGDFVPNLSFGPDLVAALRPLTALPFDVHLMLRHPENFADAFIRAGADLINFHIESAAPVADTLKHVAAAGVKTALTLKPLTPAEAVFPYLDLLDMVLVMTVEPGFGGQKFMQDMLPKVTAIRKEIDRRGLMTAVQVDGGVDVATAALAAAAGADVAVAGSAFFRAPDVMTFVQEIHRL